MSRHELDDDLLFRYLTGEVSPAEAAQVEAWISEQPGRLEAVAELRGDLERRRVELREGGERLEHAWRRVAGRIESGAAAPTGAPASLGVDFRRSPHRRRRWAVGIAAALLVGVGLARLGGRRPEPPAAATMPDTTSVVYATAPGQRTEITLADGSTVTLSVQSVLRVPRSFGRAGAREVSLEGQGFFRVTSDSSRPFTVRAGNTLTRVLGTEFDVRAYPADPHVAVMVREGRVGVARSGTTTGVLLTRGMLATVRADSVHVAAADPDQYLAWLSGTLRVHDRAVRDLLPELERWYGVRLRLTEPRLAARRVTAAFDAGERDTDLAHLATLLDARLVNQDSLMALVPE